MSASRPMTLEEFAATHDLPPRWLRLRRQCEAILRDPQFWSKRELQDAARALAVEASDLLDSERRAQTRRGGKRAEIHMRSAPE